MDVAICPVSHFRKANLLCSHRGTPLSAYILNAQAAKNFVDKTLTEDDCKYDRIMGEGTTQEVIDCIGIRSNMDGKPIPGQATLLIFVHGPVQQYLVRYLQDGRKYPCLYNRDD